ncbi:MAG: cation transporter [Actinomycetota bacterium]|nr:cation transporter [Actinomycetota bacterium]MDH4353632.1 cation transporter [Actinomycetota bacterium]MDH5278837.1 cation transporter [Actinomycetota bacterium]
MSITASYTVVGMTCGHCVSAVTEEISSLAGVESVDVELSSGSVTVTSADVLSVDDVRSAVDEAGYTLADS